MDSIDLYRFIKYCILELKYNWDFQYLKLTVQLLALSAEVNVLIRNLFYLEATQSDFTFQWHSAANDLAKWILLMAMNI